jgi:hypothetical protein
LKKDSYFFGIMACEDKDIEKGYVLEQLMKVE